MTLLSVRSDRSPHHSLRPRSLLLAIAASGFILAGCASESTQSAPATTQPAPTTTTTTTTTTTQTTTTTAQQPAPTTNQPAPTTNQPAPTTTTTQSSTTTTQPAVVNYAFPIQSAANTGYADKHHDYPATDIFDACGATVVSPVDGVVLDLQRDDRFDKLVNDPWTRGGLYVAILGNDGVRYYMAHFRAIAEGLQVGDQVSAGTPVAELGESGNAGACHVHFGISPPCPALEWWVRRGVIWPYPYLDDWRRGVWTSPAPEIEAWVLGHPEACTSYS